MTESVWKSVPSPSLSGLWRGEGGPQRGKFRGIKKSQPLPRKRLPPSAKEEILERIQVGTSRFLHYNLRRWGQEACAC